MFDQPLKPQLPMNLPKHRHAASVTDQIIESIQHCVSVLREKRPDQIKKGRMKHNDRVSLQNIIGSMPMTLDKATKSHVRTTYHNAK